MQNNNIIFRMYSKSESSLSLAPGSSEFLIQRKKIGRMRTSSDVLHFIKCNAHTLDCSVYGRAMQQCNYFQDSETCLEIFELMFKNEITRNIVNYTILFDGLGKQKRIMECIPFLDTMLRKDCIVPNVIIFTSILRGVRVHIQSTENPDSILHLLSSITKLMIKKYKILPDVLCYSELVRIYVYSYHVQKAYSYWKLMYPCFVSYMMSNDQSTHSPTMSKNNKKLFEHPFLTSSTDLINALAENGESGRMEKVWHKMNHQLNIDGDAVIFGCLMKGFLMTGNYEKVIEIWHEITQSEGRISPDYKHFQLLASCYLGKIEQTIKSQTNKMAISDAQSYLHILMNDIPKLRLRYNIKEKDTNLAKTQFRASLLVYSYCHSNENENENEKLQQIIYQLFSKLKNENKLGIKSMAVEDENAVYFNISDCEYELEMQFLMRYLFENEKNSIMKRDFIVFITVDDIYTKSDVQNEKQRKRSEKGETVKTFVLNQLKEWKCDYSIVDNGIRIDHHAITTVLEFIN